MRNGLIIPAGDDRHNRRNGAIIPLADGRYAILRNETRPEDGQLYLVGLGSEQQFRVYQVRRDGKSGCRLVPEEGAPVGIEPKLIMLFRVVGTADSV